MFEEVVKGLLGWVFKPNASGDVELQVNILLLVVLVLSLSALYKYHLRPLFKTLDGLLPRLARQSESFDAMARDSSTLGQKLDTLADRLEGLSQNAADTQNQLRTMADQIERSGEEVAGQTRELHDKTQRSLLEWLERAEDRNSDQWRELAVIQAEVRNLSTLIMATNGSRFNRPLS